VSIDPDVTGRILLALLATVLLLVAAPARAQPSDDELAERRKEAQALADEAFDLLQQSRFEEAGKLFRKADKRFHSPVFMVFAAEAEEKQGHLLEAHRLLKAISEEELADYAPDAFRSAKAQAVERLAALGPRIPRVSVTLAGDDEGATFTLDERELLRVELDAPILVDPGEHVLAARPRTGAMIERRFSVTEGETANVELELGEAPTGEGPKEEDSMRYWVPGIAFGVGAAALVVGIATGAAFIDQAGDLDERCEAFGGPLGDPNRCPPEAEEDADDVKVLGNVSTAFFVIAGAGAVAGTLLLILWPSEEESAALRIGPTSVGFELSF
jgi:hypothetical protein